MDKLQDKYELVVGLEVHLQLNTKSKAFCSDRNVFGDEINTHTSPISLAYPGTLPTANESHIISAVKLGHALGCVIQKEIGFDRKNYFYPDLPKGYQITQDRNPVCVGGKVVLEELENKIIRLHHIHLEEDAGKLQHIENSNHSIVDYNRAGTPLVEIVTEPDFRSGEEVLLFIQKLQQIARYLEISDANMEEGSLRCDCNVSVMLKGARQYGERCEIKNVNSKKFAKKAVEFEMMRQIRLIEKGEKITMQTLRFDPIKGTTSPIRSKEEAHDYRYFPDPDLVPYHLSDELINDLKENASILPKEAQNILIEQFGINAYNAGIICQEKEHYLYFNELVQLEEAYAEPLSNFFINKLIPLAEEKNVALSDLAIQKDQIIQLVQLIKQEKVSQNIAYKELFELVLNTHESSVENLAKNHGLIITDQLDTLGPDLEKLIEKYPDKFEALAGGKKQFFGLFMGELMRASKNTANPKQIKELIDQRIKEYLS